MYRQYDADAKTSGNGQVSWRHYYFLKEFFISDPSITLTTLVDTETIDITENKYSDYEMTNESIIFIDKSSKNGNRKKNTKQEIGNEFLNEYKNNNESKNSFYESLQKYYELKTNMLNSEDDETEKRSEKVENTFNEIKEIII